MPWSAIESILVVGAVLLAFWYIGDYLTEGFRPPKRLKVPKDRGLAERVSSSLQSFIDSLPRPDDDPLAPLCRPAKRDDVPLFSSRVTRVMPLWQSDEGVTIIFDHWSKRQKARVDYGIARDGDHSPIEISRTEQGLLADLMLRLMQRQDWSRDQNTTVDRCRAASEAVGFKHFEDALKWFRGHPRHREHEDDDGDDIDSSVRRRFVERVESGKARR